MTIKELYRIIDTEKPKGMSLEKYLIKHSNRRHSRNTLILVARNVKQCLKQNRMPADVVVECLANYFTIYENPELVEEEQ